MNKEVVKGFLVRAEAQRESGKNVLFLIKYHVVPEKEEAEIIICTPEEKPTLSEVLYTHQYIMHRINSIKEIKEREDVAEILKYLERISYEVRDAYWEESLVLRVIKESDNSAEYLVIKNEEGHTNYCQKKTISTTEDGKIIKVVNELDLKDFLLIYLDKHILEFARDFTGWLEKDIPIIKIRYLDYNFD